VFCPWSNKIEVTEATDPYARCTTGVLFFGGGGGQGWGCRGRGQGLRTSIGWPGSIPWESAAAAAAAAAADVTACCHPALPVPMFDSCASSCFAAWSCILWQHTVLDTCMCCCCCCCCCPGNGERTLLVDMNSPALQPPGWWEHPVPGLHHWTDVSVYELHIRDFRCVGGNECFGPNIYVMGSDHLRGKYQAFCPQHLYPTEAGLAQLKGLQGSPGLD
jgi:hypothetical protein